MSGLSLNRTKLYERYPALARFRKDIFTFKHIQRFYLTSQRKLTLIYYHDMYIIWIGTILQLKNGYHSA